MPHGAASPLPAAVPMTAGGRTWLITTKQAFYAAAGR